MFGGLAAFTFKVTFLDMILILIHRIVLSIDFIVCFTILSHLILFPIVNFIEALYEKLFTFQFSSLAVSLPACLIDDMDIFHYAENAGVVRTLWRTAYGRPGHASVHHLLT